MNRGSPVINQSQSFWCTHIFVKEYTEKGFCNYCIRQGALVTSHTMFIIILTVQFVLCSFFNVLDMDVETLHRDVLQICTCSLQNGFLKRQFIKFQYNKFVSFSGRTTLGKRSATSQRRNDQNSEMATLGTLLPFPEDSALTKDKISVVRLTSAYLKFQKFLQDGMCQSLLQ